CACQASTFLLARVAGWVGNLPADVQALAAGGMSAASAMKKGAASNAAPRKTSVANGNLDRAAAHRTERKQRGEAHAQDEERRGLGYITATWTSLDRKRERVDLAFTRRERRGAFETVARDDFEQRVGSREPPRRRPIVGVLPEARVVDAASPHVG